MRDQRTLGPRSFSGFLGVTIKNSSLAVLAVAVFVGSSLTAPVAAQVSMTTLGVASTQNFDTLATSGTANTWTDNSTPLVGWYAQFTAAGQTANPITYRADAGGSNTGAIYSWGTGTATERAFGSVGSGTPGNILRAIRLVNNTGSTITSLDVSFFGEQWRAGGCTPTPCTPLAQTLDFQYQVANAGTITDANTPSTGWTDHNSLDFVTPAPGTSTAAALDGNAAANRTALSATITVTVTAGQEVWLRWFDTNDANNDHGLGFDDFSVTPQASVTPTLNIGDVTLAEGDPAGTTTFTFAVTLTAPAGAGGVTFNISTADGTAQDDTPATEDNDYVAQSLMAQSIPMGSSGPYNFNVTVNRDLVTEPNETFFVNVDTVVGATPGDTQGLGTITNDDVALSFIHDVQGNGAATPVPGATVTVEGVVTGDFQPITNDVRLSGFFLQEEDTDADANPATSEGIFVFCSSCPTDVAAGQIVRVTGTVSEFFNLTEITASTAGSVVIMNAGNNLALVTASTIDLPVVGVVDDFYEAKESMLVSYTDTLTVSEYFEQARYGRIELYEGGRPRQFTEANPPSVPGYAAQLDNLNRRRVYLDDDDNVENSVLLFPDGTEFVTHPVANGGLSIGTQGTDFFRGGDQISGLAGILHYSFSGGSSPDEWRIRPTVANPATFTVVNPRPATPPAVGGAIRVASANVLNYFTTLNVRGADSTAELNRQRERTSIVLCSLDADVAALMEIENGTVAIADLLADVNTRCGGTHPYAFVDTGGALGTDQIRVMLIYRTGIVSPVGAPISDLDAVHNRPPTAQTFDVVDVTNPAFGERFTAVANHSKSKGCGGATGGDTDQNDGQGCFTPTRVAQHTRILTWVSGTVIPAAGDPDVLLLGDFNAYAQETPTTTLTAGGFTDLETAFQGASAYSYVFDGQLGHLDYAFASASLLPQVVGTNVWHINADENPLFDYNDEIDDGAAEAFFEEKPDGSALAPPRVLFQPASPYRASDHDPVLLGLFQIADLVVTKTDSPDPVTAGDNLVYTITVTNNGPDAAATASWSDTLPAGTTFVSQPPVAGWSCMTPSVGVGGTVSCTNPSFAVGSAVFTLTVAVAPSLTAATVLSNTATVTSATAEGNSGDESDTETTTVGPWSADVSRTKVEDIDPVFPGDNLAYTITVNNAGPSNASTVTLSDTLPAGTTFVSLASPGGWSCMTPAVGDPGPISCSVATLAPGDAIFTLVVRVAASVAHGTVITNTATGTSATADPTSGNEDGEASTTVDSTTDYFTLTPCRVLDTRPASQLASGVPLTVAIEEICGVPAKARTVVLNVTAVAPSAAGELKIYASDTTAPTFSTLAFPTTARAVIAVVSLSSDGEITLDATVGGGGTVHVILDVMGYFE
jgi:uncharacterized repeat protein (TIGR01451 family)